MTPDTAVLLGRESLTFGLLPRHQRPVRVWALGLLTLGVYWVFWYRRVSRELQRFDERIPCAHRVDWWAFALGWPIGVPQFIALHRLGRRLAAAQRAAGLTPTCDPPSGVLLWLCAGAGIGYLQAQLNAVIDRYGAPAGTPVFHFA